MKVINSYKRENPEINEVANGEIYLSSELGDRFEVSERRMAKALACCVQDIHYSKSEITERELLIALEAALGFAREFFNFDHIELSYLSEKFTKYVSYVSCLILDDEEKEMYKKSFEYVVEVDFNMRENSEEDFLLTDSDKLELATRSKLSSRYEVIF